MKQIPILGNDAFGAGARIIGTEDGGEVRTRCEHFDNTTNYVGGDDHVSLYEEEDVALKVLCNLFPLRLFYAAEPDRHTGNTQGIKSYIA